MGMSDWSRHSLSGGRVGYHGQGNYFQIDTESAETSIGPNLLTIGITSLHGLTSCQKKTIVKECDQQSEYEAIYKGPNSAGETTDKSRPETDIET